MITQLSLDKVQDMKRMRANKDYVPIDVDADGTELVKALEEKIKLGQARVDEKIKKVRNWYDFGREDEAEYGHKYATTLAMQSDPIAGKPDFYSKHKSRLQGFIPLHQLIQDNVGNYNVLMDYVTVSPNVELFAKQLNQQSRDPDKMAQYLNAVHGTLAHETQHRGNYKQITPHVDFMQHKKDAMFTKWPDAVEKIAKDYHGVDGIDNALWNLDPEEWDTVTKALGYMLYRSGMKPGKNIVALQKQDSFLFGQSGHLEGIVDAIASAQGIDYDERNQIMDALVKKVQEAYKAGNFGYASGGLVDVPDMTLLSEENRLLKQAEEMQGAEETDIEQQLIGDAGTRGIDNDVSRNLVAKVMARLQKTNTGKRGNAFGISHDPKDRYAAIKSAVGRALI